MSAETVSVSTEFDIFATRSAQTSNLDTTDTAKIPKAYVDESDLEILIPAHHDTYIDINIHLYICGKLAKADGAELDATDYTAVTNNFLHSLFSQCSITLNVVTITQAAELIIIAFISRHYPPMAVAPLVHISRTRTGIWRRATCCPVTQERLIQTRQRLHCSKEHNKTEQWSSFTDDYIVTYVTFRHIYFSVFRCR